MCRNVFNLNFHNDNNGPISNIFILFRCYYLKTVSTAQSWMTHEAFPFFTNGESLNHFTYESVVLMNACMYDLFASAALIFGK